MKSSDFQTPPKVCKYMASLIPQHAKHILEPTPGNGNLLHAITEEMRERGGHWSCKAPRDFFELPAQQFDCVVMNPPFSAKTAQLDKAPPDLQIKGMRVGYHMLTECMNFSTNIVALMPWFTIIDSDVRMRKLKAFGLISVTALPRKTFEYTRIQTMILELSQGYSGTTAFHVYETLIF